MTEVRLRTDVFRFQLRAVFAVTGFVATVAALETIDMPGTPPEVVLRRVAYQISLLVIYAVIALSWLRLLDVIANSVSHRRR